MYLNPDLVLHSFKRLVSRREMGKTHKERTSILMFFLAYDAACKHAGTEILDMDPDSLIGKNNRKKVELEFIKLVLLEKRGKDFKQVAELGKIDENGTHPEKRISSNFFTVPLKKASDQVEPYYYPRRPDTPLLKMGNTATGKKWGISYHHDWQSNFPSMLSEIKYSTPFLDLAIFICRDCKWEQKDNDIINAIADQLKKRFTLKLSTYWISKIEREKILAHHLAEPWVDTYSSFVKHYKKIDGGYSYSSMTKAQLINRIRVLEELLIDKKEHTNQC